MSELLDLAQTAVGAARSGEHVEAYAQWSRELEVKALNGEVESLSRAESRGLGVRVIAGGKLGYAYAADPDASEVAGIVEQARTNAALGSPDEGNVLPEPAPAEPLAGLLAEQIESTPTEDKVRMALDLERAARAADSRVYGMDMCAYADATARIAIASTNGVSAEYERGDCWAVSNPLAAQDGETQTGFSFALGRKPSDLDLGAIARESVERAVRLFGAAKPKSERLPVLLDQTAAASFLGVLASALTAEAVLKGRSLFSGKVGEQVASEIVDLVDDGRMLAGPGAAPFDDEGVPTRRTPVIEKGVLKGFLHNAYTAKRMGGSSTGNASRAGFKSTPGVAPTNLFLTPGKEGPEELMRRAGRALYVQDLIGVHSGANPISGDFSVGISGLIVEEGAFGAGVREAAVASTITDILTAIVAVGSDLRFFPFGGAIGAPTILVGEMTLAGT
jgi:PmbA protein